MRAATSSSEIPGEVASRLYWTNLGSGTNGTSVSVACDMMTRVAQAILLEPFEGAVIIAWHELVEVQPFDDRNIFQPRKNMNPVGADPVVRARVVRDPRIIDRDEPWHDRLAQIVHQPPKLHAQ